MCANTQTHTYTHNPLLGPLMPAGSCFPGTLATASSAFTSQELEDPRAFFLWAFLPRAMCLFVCFHSQAAPANQFLRGKTLWKSFRLFFFFFDCRGSLVLFLLLPFHSIWMEKAMTKSLSGLVWKPLIKTLSLLVESKPWKIFFLNKWV